MGEPDLVLYRTAARPDLGFWWRDDDGNLIDLSAGYTFEFKIGYVGKVAELTKTTGITGAAGSGTETDGVPNVTVSFDADELDIPAGTYNAQIRATSGGLPRFMQIDLVEVRDIIL